MPLNRTPAGRGCLPNLRLKTAKSTHPALRPLGIGRSGPRLELLASSGDTQTTRHTLLMKTLRRHVTFWACPSSFFQPCSWRSARPRPRALERPLPPRTDATATRDADRTGQFCPISGCIPAEGRPFSHAIGFAVAIVGTFWFAGRRNPARG